MQPLFVLWIMSFSAIMLLLVPKMRGLDEHEEGNGVDMKNYLIRKYQVAVQLLLVFISRVYMRIHPTLLRIESYVTETIHYVALILGRKLFQVAAAIRGRTILKEREVSSLFLQNIAKYKSEIRPRQAR